MTSSTSSFRAARDLLLRCRDDYAAALGSFEWPALDEFNWALDWFDVIAAEHPDRPALRILSDDGSDVSMSDVSMSYGSLSERSSQVAGWLRGLGVARGDRVLLMLGNVAPLWEVILATMKLGAVIIPASTLLQPACRSSPLCPAAGRGSWLTGTRLRRRGGIRTRRRSPVRLRSCQTASPGLRIRCCSTSPRGRPRCPSWSRTRRSATRWGTCRPCTGSASSRATCT